VLALTLALPACASVYAEGGSTTNKSGDDTWYAESPTGKKEYGREGGYAGIALVQGFENFDTAGTGVSADDSDVGFAIRGGWRTAEGLAFEGSLESVTGYELSAGPASIDLDFTSLSFAGKYYLSPDRVQPYAMVGFGWAWVDTDVAGLDDDAVFIRIGGGADFYLNKDVAVFGELSYNRMTGDLKDLDHVDFVIGVLFRF
jgi:opacity protein-like surface antigen